ncbi:MAG TPA: single-stranded DNA-binding protein [Bacteroidetes bacterium]|nr:single-stranded DNA-binding protein [Bacteroidota bacterium]
MVNRVILIGNLGRDPEVRRLENGAAVAKFSVATNENYQDKTTGEWQKQTEWHEIVAWRQRAEQAEKIFKKGTLVYVEGKLTHRKYTDANNIERYRTEVVANYMRKIKDPGMGGDGNYFPTHEPGSAPATTTATATANSAAPAPPPANAPTATAEKTAADAASNGDSPDGDLPF